jgi:hypothetical protein
LYEPWLIDDYWSDIDGENGYGVDGVSLSSPVGVRGVGVGVIGAGID